MNQRDLNLLHQRFPFWKVFFQRFLIEKDQIGERGGVVGVPVGEGGAGVEAVKVADVFAVEEIGGFRAGAFADDDFQISDRGLKLVRNPVERLRDQLLECLSLHDRFQSNGAP